VARLYGQIVTLARAPALYGAMAVPDTLDGRFDSLVLHVHLVLRRLGRLGAEGARMSQLLFDLMFADMDETLRELGVGDMSVGRKVRQMAEAFYGRAAAYEEALDGTGGEDRLEGALLRNLYRGTAPEPRALEALAAHVQALDRALGRLDLEAFRAARLPDFSEPVPA
jgi:cytochrome b pre-mRNA-processing protein 3